VYWIKVAIANIRLYPPGSSQALKATNAALAPVGSLLEDRSKFSLGVKDGKLLVDGALYRHKDELEASSLQRFAKMLTDSAISSITFMRGITVEELNFLLEGLSRKRWSPENIREVINKLREQGVTHVTLNEQVYVALGASAFLAEKGKALLDEFTDALDRIMKTVNEVLEMVGDLPDEAARDQAKMNIAKLLIKSDPKLLQKLIGVEETGENGAARGALQKEGSLIAGYAQEDMKEIVGDVAKLYHELKQAVPSGGATPQGVEHTKKIVNKLLSLCQQKGTATAIYQQLLEGDALELLPGWMEQSAQPQRLSAVARAEDLAQKDSLYILRKEHREELPALIRELDSQDRSDLIARLAAQLCGGLRANTADVRLEALSRIKELQDTFMGIRDKYILKNMDEVVISMVDVDPDRRVYQESGDLVSSILDRAISQRDYDRATRVVKMLRRHSTEAAGGFVKRGQQAANLITELAHRETLRTVMAELLSENPDRSQAARELLVNIGPEVVPGIVSELRESADKGVRFLLADVIKGIGLDAVALFMEEVRNEKSPQVVKRMVDAVPRIGCEKETLEVLKSMLDGPDAEIRLEIVRIIQHMEGEKVGELLCAALRDKNPYVAMEAIRLVQQRPGEEAIGILIEMVRGKPPTARDDALRLMEAACRALGQMGDERIVPDLIEIARKPGFIGRLLKTYPPGLRCEATRALARFKGRPQVAKLLQSLLADDDAEVKKAAESVKRET
jgi:hypothetical protein